MSGPKAPPRKSGGRSADRRSLAAQAGKGGAALPEIMNRQSVPEAPITPDAPVPGDTMTAASAIVASGEDVSLPIEIVIASNEAPALSNEADAVESVASDDDGDRISSEEPTEPTVTETMVSNTAEFSGQSDAVATDPDPITVPDQPVPATIVQPQPNPVAAFFLAPVNPRGFFDMATSFDNAAAAADPTVATEKVRAMFGGLNDQAQNAVEKSKKLGEEMTELSKGNVEALIASGKVIAKGAESWTHDATAFGKKSFESTTSHFKSLAAIKNPAELFQLQSEFAKSSFESLVAETSRLSEAWLKLAGEAVQPLSNRYAVAAEKLKVASL